jgi:thiamine-monophosphate kinase
MAEAGTGRRRPALSEPEIIARYFAPLAKGAPEAFGLKDDAALLPFGGDSELVVTTDTVVQGSHFHASDAPDDIAYKALAVNVSDLTAKGAEPYCYLLSLVLPHADPSWLSGFSNGLGEAQEAFGCKLVGGDTTATDGPLCISLTALGRLPRGKMVPRGGAKAGEHLYVSGTIGDAALGLQLSEEPNLAQQWGLDEDQAAYLTGRYRRPAPPVALASILRDRASAALDISDGLLGDAAKLCEASGVGGEIQSHQLPLSRPARQALGADAGQLASIMTGGDDYQVLAAIPGAQREVFEAAAAGAGVEVRAIGRLTGADSGLNAVDESGARLQFKRLSYDHFA